MRLRPTSLVLILILGWAVTLRDDSASAAEAPQKLRALIFSGYNNHDWRTTTPFLKRVLLESARFSVRVIDEPSEVTGRTLSGYDVLILNYQGPRWGDSTEKAVLDFVRSGKGLVVIHGASYAFSGLEILGDRHVRTGKVEPAWDEYIRMIGGTWSGEDPKTGHGRRHSFEVKFTNRSHPITSNMGPGFIAADELYHYMRMQPGAEVLATAYSSTETSGTGKEEPILWTVGFGRGRVFHTTLGHDVAAMQMPGFVATFARGAEWAATGRVTLPAEIQLNQVRPDASGALVAAAPHGGMP